MTRLLDSDWLIILQVRGGCGVVAYRNRLYAIGGYDGKKKKKSVEVYDPEENRCVKNCNGVLLQILFE